MELTPEQIAAQQKAIADAVAAAIVINNAERDEKEKGIVKNRDDILAEKQAKVLEAQLLNDQLILKDSDIAGLRGAITDELKSEHAAALLESDKKIKAFEKSAYDATSSSLLDGLVRTLNIKPVMQTMFIESLKSRGLTHEDGRLLIGGTDLITWNGEFSKSELYKEVVIPPNASGGGSQGGGGNSDASAHQTLLGMSGVDRLAYARSQAK